MKSKKRKVYGWVIYVEGSNDDYIHAWSSNATDLTVSEDVSHWQYIIPASEALNKLGLEPTMENLIEQLF